MAKALLGHLGGPDPRLLAEVRRLRERSLELESEVLRLRDENDALIAALADPAHLLAEASRSVATAQPALA